MKNVESMESGSHLGPFTISEVAQRYRCSKKVIYEEIRRGHLEAVRVGKKLLRITQDMLDRWQLLKATSTPTPEDRPISPRRSKGVVE